MKVLNNAILFILLLVGCSSAMAQNAADAADTVETFAVVDNDGIYTESLDARKQAIDCLASNMYYEARGEPDRGKKAVAMVTINRVKDSRYPDDICDVVKQPAQFSWYRPGKIVSLRDSGNELFKKIRSVAAHMYDVYYIMGHSDDVSYDATHFHNTRVHPKWRGRVKTAKIGNHIFYRVGK